MLSNDFTMSYSANYRHCARTNYVDVMLCWHWCLIPSITCNRKLTDWRK